MDAPRTQKVPSDQMRSSGILTLPFHAVNDLAAVHHLPADINQHDHTDLLNSDSGGVTLSGEGRKKASLLCRNIG